MNNTIAEALDVMQESRSMLNALYEANAETKGQIWKDATTIYNKYVDVLQEESPTTNGAKMIALAMLGGAVAATYAEDLKEAAVSRGDDVSQEEVMHFGSIVIAAMAQMVRDLFKQTVTGEAPRASDAVN